MSKIIHVGDTDGQSWHVYLTPIGAAPEPGDGDEYVESCGSLGEAALALLKAMALQERERIEENREAIADYESRIENQKAELSASQYQRDKAEAQEQALHRRQVALLHGEVCEQLNEAGVSFAALAEFHDAKNGQ